MYKSSLVHSQGIRNSSRSATEKFHVEQYFALLFAKHYWQLVLTLSDSMSKCLTDCCSYSLVRTQTIRCTKWNRPRPSVIRSRALSWWHLLSYYRRPEYTPFEILWHKIILEIVWGGVIILPNHGPHPSWNLSDFLFNVARLSTRRSYVLG